MKPEPGYSTTPAAAATHVAEAAVPNPAAALFDGGGRMGELMRSIDWARTPVGRIETWPQSLKTALSVLLKQRTAVFIFWGPEHVQFYNDAYRPILGTKKHPAAMGQRGAECWPEIWDIIAPMVQAVHRGESTAVEDGLLVIDRQGYLEEGYYTYTYSPIVEESGTVGGVFCVVYDTTARVIGERRLRTLRDLASRTITKDAAEACRLAAATLSENSYDVPFAALYLYDDSRKWARLAGVAGVEMGSAAAPSDISFEGDLSSLARVANLGRVTEIPDLALEVGPLPGGPWPVPATSGIMLPITVPGQSLPTGFLLAGINPRKRLDADYRTFFELVAGQIATAVAEARAYEEERKRAQALAELDRVKTVFFSNVSHEFRTPLTLMLGPLTDVLTGPPVPMEDCRRQLAIAHRNCLRLLKLVNTLLDFSRIEAGRIQARYEPTDLATLTGDLASTFRSAIERANLRLIVDCKPLPHPVFVDREMWEKIVLNLLSNAFKFTFEGQIRVALAPVDGKAELSVSDTGVGIPESELPRVFERFHRIEGGKARSQEGSGIGLALVHELARLHGATVHVESEYGRGSTFTVSIPFGSRHLPQDRISPPRTQSSTALGAQPFVEEAQRWLPDAPATLADAVPLPRISQEGETSPAHRPLVLVADDNADMREYLRRLLSDHYEVLTVADGESALEMVKSRPPDLLLADVMMPGMDGFRLLHEVRRDPASGSLPVILLSARAGEESRVEGLRAGADDYMVKPFSARELLVCISSRLEITKLRKASAEKEHLLLAEADTEREKLRALIEQAPALVAVLSGPDHVFQIVNREYLKASGRPEGDLIGRPIREALPEIIGQVFLELLNRVYKTGRPFIGTEMLARLNRRGDGTLEDCYFNFVYQAWRDAAGSIQGVFVHAVDVTEQVLARRRLEESQQALRTLVDKERQARSTAELLNRVGPTLLGQLDFKALVQSVTDIATQITAAEAGAFFQAPAPGHGGPRLPYTSSGSLDTAPLARYWDLHSTGSPAADPFRCNIVDQVPEFRSLLGCSVVSRSGEVLGALVFGHSEPGRFTQSHEDMLAGIAAQAAIAMDNARLFEQAQWIQNELKRSNEELRRANRDLEVFAYSASHDLQEPLRTIAISAELIAAGWGQRLSGDDAMFLDNIVTASRRMAALIQDLLAYTRATKAQEGPPRAVEAAPVLARVLENLKTSIEETGASVTCAELPAVAIHETPLAQLFQNLISNAIKYRGSAPPRIYITAEQRDGWCIFSVTDNGIGIEPRFREQVFGLFKRLHGRDEYPGSGVGLAICQRLVEQYGGRIWIQNSEPGKGSTFCFAVPPGPSALG